jgi:hypothetical protein
LADIDAVNPAIDVAFLPKAHIPIAVMNVRFRGKADIECKRYGYASAHFGSDNQCYRKRKVTWGKSKTVRSERIAR